MPGIVYAPAGRLVEILGVVAALKFAGRFGGRRLSVPQPERLKPEGALAATVGFELALKVCFEWRGLEIMVPKCRIELARELARSIHAEPEGMSVREIARKYEITERWAFAILSKPAPGAPAAGKPSAQRSLFPET